MTYILTLIISVLKPLGYLISWRSKGRFQRPQHMLMRVVVRIYKHNIDSITKTYHLMSHRWFTHASPTLFIAGKPRLQLNRCFLENLRDNSIEGIYYTLEECDGTSKSTGGNA